MRRVGFTSPVFAAPHPWSSPLGNALPTLRRFSFVWVCDRVAHLTITSNAGDPTWCVYLTAWQDPVARGGSASHCSLSGHRWALCNIVMI